jgi:cell division protein FtsB
VPPKPILFFSSALIFLAALALVIVFGDDGVMDLLALKREKTLVEAKRDKIFDENISLYRQIDRLKNDAAFIEATARKELGVVREDELILKLKQGE